MDNPVIKQIITAASEAGMGCGYSLALGALEQTYETYFPANPDRQQYEEGFKFAIKLLQALEEKVKETWNVTPEEAEKIGTSFIELWNSAKHEVMNAIR